MSCETMLLSPGHISCLQHMKHTANAPGHPRVAGHVQGSGLGKDPRLCSLNAVVEPFRTPHRRGQVAERIALHLLLLPSLFRYVFICMHQLPVDPLSSKEMLYALGWRLLYAAVTADSLKFK